MSLTPEIGSRISSLEPYIAPSIRYPVVQFPLGLEAVPQTQQRHFVFFVISIVLSPVQMRACKELLKIEREAQTTPPKFGNALNGRLNIEMIFFTTFPRRNVAFLLLSNNQL